MDSSAGFYQHWPCLTVAEYYACCIALVCGDWYSLQHLNHVCLCSINSLAITPKAMLCRAQLLQVLQLCLTPFITAINHNYSKPGQKLIQDFDYWQTSSNNSKALLCPDQRQSWQSSAHTVNLADCASMWHHSMVTYDLPYLLPHPKHWLASWVAITSVQFLGYLKGEREERLP